MLEERAKAEARKKEKRAARSRARKKKREKKEASSRKSGAGHSKRSGHGLHRHSSKQKQRWFFIDETNRQAAYPRQIAEKLERAFKAQEFGKGKLCECKYNLKSFF